jgi:hypothetical protein
VRARTCVKQRESPSFGLPALVFDRLHFSSSNF